MQDKYNTKRIGNFTLYQNSIIGKGSFGEVVLARSDQHSGVVACKIINLNNKHSTQLRSIEREIEVLQTMQQTHPNIVAFHAALKTSNNVYIFLEYCDSGDLKQFIKKRSAARTLTEADAKYVLRDIVRGLRHLSTVCKVMHRDIKLDNILVKKKANVNADPLRSSISNFEFKLGDLGLATPAQSDRHLHNTLCGTPLYMAPEVIEN